MPLGRCLSLVTQFGLAGTAPCWKVGCLRYLECSSLWMSFGSPSFLSQLPCDLGCVCTCVHVGGGEGERRSQRRLERQTAGEEASLFTATLTSPRSMPSALQLTVPPPAHSCVPSVNTIPCQPQGPTSPRHTQASQLPPPLHTDPVHTDHFRFRFPASPA